MPNYKDSETLDDIYRLFSGKKGLHGNFLIDLWEAEDKKFPKMNTDKSKYVGFGRWVIRELPNSDVIVNYIALANLPVHVYQCSNLGCGLWFYDHTPPLKQKKIIETIETLL